VRRAALCRCRARPYRRYHRFGPGTSVLWRSSVPCSRSSMWACQRAAARLSVSGPAAHGPCPARHVLGDCWRSGRCGRVLPAGVRPAGKVSPELLVAASRGWWLVPACSARGNRLITDAKGASFTRPSVRQCEPRPVGARRNRFEANAAKRPARVGAHTLSWQPRPSLVMMGSGVRVPPSAFQEAP
jgi:hypothetical protein